MPEIPEMENYRTMLLRTVTGKQVTGVWVERPKSINVAVNELSAALNGQVIDNVTRRAKLLVFHLRGGLYLVTHMMLDGRLYYGTGSDHEGLPGKPHVIIGFSDGGKLFFCDLGLGFLHLVDSLGLEAELAGLGLEPLSPDFTWGSFMELFRKRRGAVKPLLMDQRLIAGLGNAYSNEVLFAARILPAKKIPEIGPDGLKRLWEVIPRILREAINNGGYIEEKYAQWDNRSGGQIPHFMIYDRGGEPCSVCGNPIGETKLNGRWTYMCSTCQH